MNPAIRRIFISNLNFHATEADVRNLLAAYGTVQRVTIVKDRATAASRGFGFVEMQGAAEGPLPLYMAAPTQDGPCGWNWPSQNRRLPPSTCSARSARRTTRAARPPDISQKFCLVISPSNFVPKFRPLLRIFPPQ
jgi:hypothetical protein